MSESFGYVSPPPRELLAVYGVPEDVIDGVLCMHAHELAEKIRAEFADAFDANQEVLSGTDAMVAADLIDPEVTA